MINKKSNNASPVHKKAQKKSNSGKRIGKSKPSKANNQLNRRVK